MGSKAAETLAAIVRPWEDKQQPNVQTTISIFKPYEQSSIVKKVLPTRAHCRSSSPTDSVSSRRASSNKQSISTTETKNQSSSTTTSKNQLMSPTSSQNKSVSHTNVYGKVFNHPSSQIQSPSSTNNHSQSPSPTISPIQASNFSSSQSQLSSPTSSSSQSSSPTSSKSPPASLTSVYSQSSIPTSNHTCSIPTPATRQISSSSSVSSNEGVSLALSHLELLKEFQTAPRTSFSGSLWINALFQSYLHNIQTRRDETDRLEVIKKTRSILQVYLLSTKTQASFQHPQVSMSPVTPPCVPYPVLVITPDSGYKSPAVPRTSPPSYSIPQEHKEQASSIRLPPPVVLEDWYQENIDCPYATDPIAEDLAFHSGMSKLQVLKWLSNRRNRDGNTKKTAGRRRKHELNRAKPYTPKSLPQTRLKFSP